MENPEKSKKQQHAENSRKGAKKSPWSKWNPGAFSKDKSKRDWSFGDK